MKKIEKLLKGVRGGDEISVSYVRDRSTIHVMYRKVHSGDWSLSEVLSCGFGDNAELMPLWISHGQMVDWLFKLSKNKKVNYYLFWVKKIKRSMVSTYKVENE
jgi:hypothetical protein